VARGLRAVDVREALAEVRSGGKKGGKKHKRSKARNNHGKGRKRQHKKHGKSKRRHRHK
jgi:hypothetical protein